MYCSNFFLINIDYIFVPTLFPVFFYLQYRMKLHKTSPTLPWSYSAVTRMGTLQNWLCCYFPRSTHTRDTKTSTALHTPPSTTWM